MSYRYEDFSENKSKADDRVPCALGNDCTHKTVEECDAHRQQLLEEEHKKKCGPNCGHFGYPAKGIPSPARFQGLNPAEFLLKSRGL